MSKHQIIIVDNGLTEIQKIKLTSLEFKANKSIPTKWIYNAMDSQDLVDVVEDLELSRCLDGVHRKIKFGKRI